MRLLCEHHSYKNTFSLCGLLQCTSKLQLLYRAAMVKCTANDCTLAESDEISIALTGPWRYQ
jgi:hypothetical protein